MTSKKPLRNPRTTDVRVRNFKRLMTPGEICATLPLPRRIERQVLGFRRAIHACLKGADQRLVVIVGPCSIHDVEAGMDYARRLRKLQEHVAGTLLVVMRVYFEKPRTTIGWKGLINDPHLDGSNDIQQGLLMARRFLLDVNALGLPCATEFLDPIVPQYTSDLVSWAAIGARTTESQTHRELASGLSMPVGFKNATDGGLQVALDAVVSARVPHAFLGIDGKGRICIVTTAGNPDVHVILRGGGGKTNYGRKYIAMTEQALGDAQGERMIMVDCSHGNSQKNYQRQGRVFEDLLKQYLGGTHALVGVMLESFIEAGSQSIDKRPLVYGQSITDGCIDWPQTDALLRNAHRKLLKARGT